MHFYACVIAVASLASAALDGSHADLTSDPQEVFALCAVFISSLCFSKCTCSSSSSSSSSSSVTDQACTKLLLKY